MSKEVRLYMLVAVLFVLGAGLGFSMGKNMSSAPFVQQEEVTSPPDPDIYTVQSAIIRGVIDQVNGKILKITNQNTNTQGEIKVSDRFVVVGPKGNSSNPSAVETGKPVVINLEMINGEYQAISVQYMTPVPSLPPIPLGSEPPPSQ